MDTTGDGSQLGDIPTRPMRVKILYTFDAENKTTCLARFPNTLNIPAVPIDDQSQVGVIELQQCVEAVVAASPEILTKLDSGDFTIYAFDYSEFETPLVGQGRLSSLLAGPGIGISSSQQNKTMITGRVCKNLPALFNNGVKETLEVKLRFTPVSKPTQKEYTKPAEGSRTISPATSTGFDPNAWNASLQQQPSDYFSFESLSAGGDASAALLEDMFGVDSDMGLGNESSGVGIPETPKDAPFAANPAFSSHSHSAPGSRSGTPNIRPDSNLSGDALRHQSFSGNPSNVSDHARPDSRASIRSEAHASYHQRHTSTQSQPQHPLQSDEFYNEDGVARKRAKVQQADWHGRSSFGAKSSDLRVTAATASSMQMFRPIPKRPSAPGSNLEPPPRVPTPVPQRTRKILDRTQLPGNPRSMLRQASTADSDFMSDADIMSDALMSSPEGSSPGDSIAADGTPLEIPSSPPIMPGYNLPQPSSPSLPALPKPRTIDSGYMSEPIIHSGSVVQSFENDNARSAHADQTAMNIYAAAGRRNTYIKEESLAGSTSPQPMDVPPSSEMNILMDNVQMEAPGDMNRLPQRVLLNLPPGRRGGSQAPKPPKPANSGHSRRPTVTDLPVEHSEQPSNTESSLSRRGSLALPSAPSIGPSPQNPEPAVPEKVQRRPLQRSRTGATDSEAGSPAPSDTEGRPRGQARSGSAAPRRKVIERKLQESLAKGEMPEYCTHCGAIETPTWRKLYVKYVDGHPSPLDSVEGEGETVGVHSLERDAETGKITKFVIRKMMKKTKDSQPGKGFEPAVVCNPCGLWFNKTRQMRPSEKWHKSSLRRRKRNRADDDMGTDGIEPESEAFFTDQITREDLPEGTTSDENGQSEPTTTSVFQSSKRSRSNSMSMQPSRRASDESGVLTARDGTSLRAIQSSPVRFHGSQETPIELDLTPNPTRRLLFPSPRQAGEVKSLNGSDLPRHQTGSPSEKADHRKPATPSKIITTPGQTDVDVFGAFAFGKENVAPTNENDNDDLAYLFEGSPSAIFKTPQRKTPGRKALPNDLLKTPTPSSRKRRALTPSQNAANNANMNGNDFMTSPSSSRYFLRSTPSRLERTPGGRSHSSNHQAVAHDMTPFSRHLADMLHNAGAMQEAPFTSPSRQFDFTDLPTFSTPGRDMNWKEFDEMLSSEFATFDGLPDAGINGGGSDA